MLLTTVYFIYSDGGRVQEVRNVRAGTIFTSVGSAALKVAEDGLYIIQAAGNVLEFLFRRYCEVGMQPPSVALTFAAPGSPVSVSVTSTFNDQCELFY